MMKSQKMIVDEVDEDEEYWSELNEDVERV